MYTVAEGGGVCHFARFPIERRVSAQHPSWNRNREAFVVHSHRRPGRTGWQARCGARGWRWHKDGQRAFLEGLGVQMPRPPAPVPEGPHTLAQLAPPFSRNRCHLSVDVVLRHWTFVGCRRLRMMLDLFTVVEYPYLVVWQSAPLPSRLSKSCWSQGLTQDTQDRNCRMQEEIGPSAKQGER